MAGQHPIVEFAGAGTQEISRGVPRRGSPAIIRRAAAEPGGHQRHRPERLHRAAACVHIGTHGVCAAAHQRLGRRERQGRARECAAARGLSEWPLRDRTSDPRHLCSITDDRPKSPYSTVTDVQNVTAIGVTDNARPTMSRSVYHRPVHVILELVGEFLVTFRYSPYTVFCGLGSNATPSPHLLMAIDKT